MGRVGAGVKGPFPLRGELRCGGGWGCAMMLAERHFLGCLRALLFSIGLVWDEGAFTDAEPPCCLGSLLLGRFIVLVVYCICSMLCMCSCSFCRLPAIVVLYGYY